jgi:hypothetical protein
MTEFSDDSDKAQQSISRRTFMLVTGVAALSAALPDIPLPEQELVKQAIIRQRESMKPIIKALLPAIGGKGNISAETVRKRCIPALRQAARHTREAFRLKQRYGLKGDEYNLFTVNTWINPNKPTEYVLSGSDFSVKEHMLDTPDKLIAYIHQAADKAIHHLCEVLPSIRAHEEHEKKVPSSDKTMPHQPGDNHPDWSKLCDDTQNVFHAARGEQEESPMERLLRQRITTSKSKQL